MRNHESQRWTAFCMTAVIAEKISVGGHKTFPQQICAVRRANSGYAASVDRSIAAGWKEEKIGTDKFF